MNTKLFKEKDKERRFRDVKSDVYVLVDIARFMLYNDEFGHEKGDEVLKQLELDINTLPVRNVNRVGGDEFSFIIDWDYYEYKSDLQQLQDKFTESYPSGLHIVATYTKYNGKPVDYKSRADYTMKMLKNNRHTWFLETPNGEQL